MHVSIGNLNSPRRKKIYNQSKIATCFQSVKYRLTVWNVYSQQCPLVDVYEAEIRRSRTEKEVLKLQQNAQVIQLNDTLAQLQTLKEEQAPFNASQMGILWGTL